MASVSAALMLTLAPLSVVRVRVLSWISVVMVRLALMPVLGSCQMNWLAVRPLPPVLLVPVTELVLGARGTSVHVERRSPLIPRPNGNARNQPRSAKVVQRTS
jgi:hypothetical protein